MQRPNDPAIVCLLDDDDEITDGALQCPIIIDSDSEDDGGGKMTANDVYPMKYNDVMIVDPGVTSGVTMFDAFLPTGVARATTAIPSKSDHDDEFQIIGDKNAMRLPHMRQHCVEHRFVEDNSRISVRMDATDVNECNQKYCNLCYCFVCDVPASECK